MKSSVFRNFAPLIIFLKYFSVMTEVIKEAVNCVYFEIFQHFQYSAIKVIPHAQFYDLLRTILLIAAENSKCRQIAASVKNSSSTHGMMNRNKNSSFFSLMITKPFFHYRSGLRKTVFPGNFCTQRFCGRHHRTKNVRSLSLVLRVLWSHMATRE